MARSLALSEVLICEDHYVSAIGIEMILRKHSPHPLQVRMAHSGRDALSLLGQESPHIAIVDLSLPDISGIVVIKSIRENHPSTHVIVLTALDDPHLIRQVQLLRVAAILRKNDTDLNLQRALHFLPDRKGKTYLDSSVEEILKITVNQALSPREYEVVALMSEGLTSGEIAARMDCSPATVKTYRSRILAKSGARNSAEIMARYLKGNGK